MRSFFLLIVFTLSISPLWAQLAEADSLYFGQATPTDKAVLFAPELISQTGRYEHDICFSPDGTEMFFSTSKANWSDFTIFYSKWTGENWTDIKTADFSKANKNTEIVFSPSGNSIYFASSKSPGSAPWDFALFKSIRTDTAWSIPEEIGIKALQPSGNDGNWHPAVSSDLTVFFSSYKSGNYDIYFSEYKNDNYVGFNNAGPEINSSSNDWYPWVSPDKKTLIFSSNRNGGFGKSDLYVSFKNELNEWGTPINLGNEINTSDDESSPRITSDGKYFFFTRTKNWDGDFYWVSATFIDNLREANKETSTMSVKNDSFDINVYPNPSCGRISICHSKHDVSFPFKLIDPVGRVIHSGIIGNGESVLDLTELPKGIYILGFESKGKIKNTRICLY